MTLPLHARLPRVRLLPPEQRWIPYAWLVYLGSYFVEPIVRGWQPWYWAATIAGALMFLASYFRGHWERGGRLVAIVALQAGLGVGFSLSNAGAGVFFIYAASFAGRLERPRNALRLIAAVTAIGAATAWLIHPTAWYWMTTLVFAPLIGGVNLHFHQVGRANAGLRLAHAEIERLAAVAERERIARDLHDVLGHTLSLITLKSQLAGRLVGRDAERALQEILEVEQVARSAMSEVRQTIRGYRATLDDEVARARALLAAAGIAGEFALEVTAPDARRDEVLAFVLREGVTNVARHSGATRCHVRVTASEGGCTLTIDDDGRGAVLAAGSGVRGMRERVAATGGTLTYHASDGTRLAVTLPAAGAVPLHEPARRAG